MTRRQARKEITRMMRRWPENIRLWTYWMMNHWTRVYRIAYRK